LLLWLINPDKSSYMEGLETPLSFPALSLDMHISLMLESKGLSPQPTATNKGDRVLFNLRLGVGNRTEH
jgi:hypothetical protein